MNKPREPKPGVTQQLRKTYGSSSLEDGQSEKLLIFSKQHIEEFAANNLARRVLFLCFTFQETETQQLAQGHASCKWPRQDLHPVLADTGAYAPVCTFARILPCFYCVLSFHLQNGHVACLSGQVHGLLLSGLNSSSRPPISQLCDFGQGT